MCGIIGYSGSEPFNLQNINTLIYINALERGDDATGIYSPLNGLKKDNINGWSFATNGKVEIKPDTILLGHVRAATIGMNTKNNAHPFERGNCVLIHNGTLTNHTDLAKKYKLLLSSYDVDSDVLTGCINEADSLEPLKEIDGPAALVFSDKRQPNKLFVFRNNARPLYRGHIGPNMYISSIEESLQIIGCINIKQFKENLLYIIEKGLILGNPKKIKNSPYKEPIKTYNNTPSLYIQNSRVGCNVRALETMHIRNTNGKQLNLIKGKYYEIVSSINPSCLKIHDDITNDNYLVGTPLLEMKDIIERNDYVIALENVYHRQRIADIVVEKGDINKVVSVFTDGDCSLNTPNEKWAAIAKKSQLRKLSFKELTIFLETGCSIDDSSLQNNIRFLDSAVCSTTVPIKPIIQFKIPLNLNNLIENSFSENLNNTKDIINKVVENKIYITMSINELEVELSEYFIMVDELLIAIKKKIGDYENEDAIQIANRIDNISWKLYNKIYTMKDA